VEHVLTGVGLGHEVFGTERSIADATGAFQTVVEVDIGGADVVHRMDRVEGWVLWDLGGLEDFAGNRVHRKRPFDRLSFMGLAAL